MFIRIIVAQTKSCQHISRMAHSLLSTTLFLLLVAFGHCNPVTTDALPEETSDEPTIEVQQRNYGRGYGGGHGGGYAKPQRE